MSEFFGKVSDCIGLPDYVDHTFSQPIEKKKENDTNLDYICKKEKIIHL